MTMNSPTSSSTSSTATECLEKNLNLSIFGFGVEYPPFRAGPEALETLARRHYPDSEALQKTLSINNYTGIISRAVVGTTEHPLVNGDAPPSIKELNSFFMDEGVRLSVAACRTALAEWGGCIGDVTHVVSTTCTNSANPGFDHYVSKALGIGRNVEKVLLHGVGCSGGMAALRTASNFALGATYRGMPARILVLACEISSVLVRSELESVHQDQKVGIGACLFSDCASACVLSNGVPINGAAEGKSAIFDILGWHHEILEDTEEDLRFDVDPLGWKVILSKRVPSLVSTGLPLAFRELVDSVPSLALEQDLDGCQLKATDFEWALHPGGATVIMGIENVMGLSQEHLWASYEVYMQYGNSSSATIFSVMDRLRRSTGKKNVVGCAFGPGISMELMILRRKC